MGVGDEMKDQLSFLGGFKLTFQHLTRPRVTTPVPGREEAEAAAPARPPRPQPLRGRDGEVHRLRAVRRGVPGRLHLRARAGQPARPPGVARASATATSTRSTTCAASTATCASRRARPRPSPSPSCSSSPSPTAPTPSTPRTSCWSTTTGRPSSSPWEDWREGDDAMTSGWMRATSPSGSAAYEGEVQWSGELGYGVRAPEGGQSGRRDDAATGNKPLRQVLEPHLLDEDIPLEHRGMQGRVCGPRRARRATARRWTPPGPA